VPWPRRTALLVGEPPDPRVPVILYQLGFTTAVTNLDRAEQDANPLGAFTFLLLTGQALGSDDALDRVRRLRVLSPSAKVLLQRSRGPLDPEVLVRALRAGVADVIDLVEGAPERALAAGLREAGRLRERVLAIGAHPDDVELGCAGTLLDHRLRGDRVSILTLSRGGIGGDPDVRLGESVAGAQAIGAQLLFADLPDGRIDDGPATIQLIEAAVRALDPTVVYTHSRNDNHQDHRAVAVAAVSATRDVRRVFAFQSPSATNDFRPTQFVPIDAVVRRKVHALSQFASQGSRSYLDPEFVVSAARYWARQLGANARYAEPFEVIRSMGDLRQNAAVAERPAQTVPGSADTVDALARAVGDQDDPAPGQVAELLAEWLS
jgi:LmbE family N-acetylglucosaminyl deacetylase